MEHAAEWLTPTNVVLALTLVLAAFVVVRAQRRQDFDFADAMRGFDGKASIARIASLGAFAASTWVVMNATVGGKITDAMFLTYCVTWSGSMLLSKWIDKLPDTKRDDPK